MRNAKRPCTSSRCRNVISAVFLALVYTICVQGCRAGDTSIIDRAVSLKILQEQAKQCMAEGNCPENILTLCGLRKVHGYLVDKTNNDLIILGQAKSSSPSLHLDDLVVALRSVWGVYDSVHGYIHYHEPPGCSIDPDSNVMRQLNSIGNRIVSSSSLAEVEREIERWHETCKQPQDVQVFGIPFNTRFAKIMVDADYYMKRLVDGSVSLEIEGFASLVDMTLNKVKDDILNNRPISISGMSMNRFWFYPGENKYKYDSGIVLIDQCPVILLTEAEYLTQHGTTSGTGKPDPLAQKFAESFSFHYSEIAEKESLYSELEGLFRFVALARIMKYEGRGTTIDLDYLLDQVPISHVKDDPTLPGISRVKEFIHRWDSPGGYEILRLWLPSCGGVGIEIDVGPKNSVKDETSRLAEFRDSILRLRPSREALFWDFPG